MIKLKGIDGSGESRLINRLTVLLLIFIFPVGAAFMWLFCGWKRYIKILITALLATIVILNIFAANRIDDTIFTSPYEQKVNIYSDNIENPVWITSSGTRYHTEDCSVLKDSGRSIPLAEALDKNMTPCSKCHPDEEDAAAATESEAAVSTAGTVWVTESGTKYHREGCSSIRNGAVEITYEAAIARGLEPCGICKP